MKFKSLAVIAILITIFGVSISYASLSTILEISSSGAVRKANWDIHFNDLSDATIVGDLVINTAPQLSPETTSITNLDVKFNDITGSVTYYFDVVNEGDLDAVISNISNPGPICTVPVETPGVDPADTAADIANVCNAITYSLEYVEVGGTYTPVSINDTLAAGETKRLRLTFAYNDSLLPLSEVRISNLSYLITYVQDK